MRLRFYTTNKVSRATTSSKNPIYSWTGHKDLWCLMRMRRRKKFKFYFLLSTDNVNIFVKQKKNILTFMNKKKGGAGGKRMNERTDNRVFINMNWGFACEMCQWVCSGSMTINSRSFPSSLFARVKCRFKHFVIKYLLKLNKTWAALKAFYLHTSSKCLSGKSCKLRKPELREVWNFQSSSIKIIDNIISLRIALKLLSY